MVKRRKFTDQLKAKVALEALCGDKTIQEIAAKHQVHPNQIHHRNAANLSEKLGPLHRDLHRCNRHLLAKCPEPSARRGSSLGIFLVNAKIH